LRTPKPGPEAERDDRAALAVWRAAHLARNLSATVEQSTSAVAAPPPAAPPSPWSPFRHRAFTALWVATVVANIGSWMYSAASAWLMTGLDPDPLAVSLVQVATTLPMFLFAIPAGALADIVDERRFLIGAECLITVVATIFAVLVWFHLITAPTLLLFIFLIEAGSAATTPAYQSVVPQLVPREDLAAAVAMNSVGINVSRAVGPALGGIITGALGIAAPFWANAISNFGSIAALWSWHPKRDHSSHLPSERFAAAIRIGIRHARNNRHLRATIVRSTAFMLFASCYWALLPLVARQQIGGSATLYGILLGAIGASAIAGAVALPWLKTKLGPNHIVAAGSIGTALALILYGVARGPLSALAASTIAGASWIAVISNLSVSAQYSLPEWVRGRGLAVYVTALFGALTLGSAIWGQVARVAGVPMAHFFAAASVLVAIPLTWRWKLQTGASVDFTPSMSWPAPVISQSVDDDAGPVLVTVEYRIQETARDAFLDALDQLSRERRADGAYEWAIFEDVAETGRFLETFLLDSWLEHLRQHERVTNADRVLQESILRLLRDKPLVTHLIAAHRPRK